MELNKKVKIVFDGSTDVKTFLTKVELETSLKDYVDEKKANFLASRLVGPAFDVYMRLSDKKKKDFEEIKADLKKEFERGKLNREEALHVLQTRVQGSKESPQTFAHKLLELVKLAYPNFTDEVRNTISKDYFMKGVHPDMQVALKSRATFAEDDISTLAEETVRLSLAGVKSFSTSTTTSENCGSVEAVQPSHLPVAIPGGSSEMINAIADVVVSKMKESSLVCSGGDDGEEKDFNRNVTVNNARYQFRGRGGRGRRGYHHGGRSNQDNSGQGPGKACRACKKTDHLIKNCPDKFCEACGQRGHNQYDRSCPNYC